MLLSPKEIKIARRRLGLKQSDMAKILGVCYRTYQYAEAGRALEVPDESGKLLHAIMRGTGFSAIDVASLAIRSAAMAALNAEITPRTAMTMFREALDKICDKEDKPDVDG